MDNYEYYEGKIIIYLKTTFSSVECVRDYMSTFNRNI
jgi:hypothetical protein